LASNKTGWVGIMCWVYNFHAEGMETLFQLPLRVASFLINTLQTIKYPEPYDTVFGRRILTKSGL